MAKDKLTDYDSTASGNLDVGGISVAEGMLPSGVNNAIRELMSHQKEAFGSGTPLYVDQVNNRVGINQAAPAHPVHVGTDDLIVDASGNLLVGTTDPLVGSGTGNNTEGLALSAGSYGGYATFSRSGSECLNLNRKTNDGTILNFRKDGTTVGSIGVDYSTRMYIGTGGAGVFFNSDVPTLQPYSITSGDVVDNTIDIGASSTRFNNLYLSGGVYLGGTAAANHLDDYEEGTWTPTPTNLTTSGTVTYTGTYTKIGRFVFGLLAVSSVGGTTTATADSTRFSGLPFTSDGINGMALSINTSTSGSTAAGQVAGTSVITGGWSAASSIRMSFWYTST